MSNTLIEGIVVGVIVFFIGWVWKKIVDNKKLHSKMNVNTTIKGNGNFTSNNIRNNK